MSDAIQLSGYFVLTFGLGVILGAAVALNGMHLWIRSRLRKAIKVWHESSAMLDEAVKIMKLDDEVANASKTVTVVDEKALASFLANDFQTDFVDEDSGGPNAFAIDVAESVRVYFEKKVG